MFLTMPCLPLNYIDSFVSYVVFNLFSLDATKHWLQVFNNVNLDYKMYSKYFDDIKYWLYGFNKISRL